MFNLVGQKPLFMKTSKWPVLILIAYFVINTLVILGITKITLFEKGETNWAFDFLPFTLSIAAVLLVCQYFLFNVKVSVVDKRPVPKRKITLASIFTALLMAILTFTAFIVVFLVLVGKDGPVLNNDSYQIAFNAFLFVLFFGSWTFWAFSFLATYKENMPGEFMRKLIKRVMIGSVLELLIAIPSHIIFRNRGDCCAPIASYFGIVMGTTVLLFAFGPGIVFLYLKRMQDKKSKKDKTKQM